GLGRPARRKGGCDDEMWALFVAELPRSVRFDVRTDVRETVCKDACKGLYWRRRGAGGRFRGLFGVGRAGVDFVFTSFAPPQLDGHPVSSASFQLAFAGTTKLDGD